MLIVRLFGWWLFISSVLALYLGGPIIATMQSPDSESRWADPYSRAAQVLIMALPALIGLRLALGGRKREKE